MSESRDTPEDTEPKETTPPASETATSDTPDSTGEPESTPPARAATGSGTTPAATGGKGRGLLFALLFLLILGLAAAGGYGGWWLYEQQQATADRLAALADRDNARVADLEARMDELAAARANGAEQRSAMAERQAAHATALEGLVTTTERLEERLGRTGPDWILAEVAHLLRTARYREHLAGDTAGARAALSAADGRLAELNDPGLQPVREAIAAAQQRLAGREQPDITGLSARLGGLAATVDELPLRHPGREGEPLATEDVVAEREGWRRHLDSVLETLGELVVIRRHDQAVEALVAPEQEALLQLNLRLQLEAAQVALLREDEALFRNHVQRAHDWIAHYFDPDAETTRNALATLEQAADISLTTPTVDLSGPLDALNEATGGVTP